MFTMIGAIVRLFNRYYCFYILSVIKMWIYFFRSKKLENRMISSYHRIEEKYPTNKHILGDFVMVKPLMLVYVLGYVQWVLQTIHDPIHIPFYVGMYLKWLMIHHRLPVRRLSGNEFNFWTHSKIFTCFMYSHCTYIYVSHRYIGENRHPYSVIWLSFVLCYLECEFISYM